MKWRRTPSFWRTWMHFGAAHIYNRSWAEWNLNNLREMRKPTQGELL